jgi:hypothetical protein
MSEATHRVVRKPRMDARHLAEYMAASDRARRSIIQRCKYQRIAQVVQHSEARLAVGKLVRGETDLDAIGARADALRQRIATNDFERTLWDTNADYLARVASVWNRVSLPAGEITTAGDALRAELNGVAIKVELVARVSRLTRTNRTLIGGLALRYSKGKAVDPDEASWQSAIIFGALADSAEALNAAAEKRLCLTLDAYAGAIFDAPSDAVTRYKNAAAACATIADGWDNVAPPKGAVLKA